MLAPIRLHAARPAAIFAAAAALTLAGCSGSGPAATSPTTRPAGSPPTIRPTATLSASLADWRLSAPVSRPAVAVDGDRLVVLGGLATGDVSTAAVWSVDPATGATRRAGTLPRAVHDAAGAFLGGAAFVFGGGSFSTVAAVQSCSSTGCRMVGDLPQPRSDLAAAQIGGRAYVVGGFDGTRMTTDVLATSDGSQFSVVGQLAVPVRYPAVAAAAGSVWVVGGQLSTAESSSVGGQSDAVQRFDPVTGRTVVVGHLPEPLGHAAAVALDGQLFVVGGRSGTAPSAQIWSVNTRTGAVRAAGELPGPRSDAGAAVAGGVGWLVGGEVSGPTAPLDTVVELRPSG